MIAVWTWTPHATMLSEYCSCVVVQSFIVVYKIPQRPSCETQTRKLDANTSSSDNVVQNEEITEPQTNFNLRYDQAQLHRSAKEAKQTRKVTILRNHNASRRKSWEVGLTEGPSNEKRFFDDLKSKGG